MSPPTAAATTATTIATILGAVRALESVRRAQRDANTLASTLANWDPLAETSRRCAWCGEMPRAARHRPVAAFQPDGSFRGGTPHRWVPHWAVYLGLREVLQLVAGRTLLPVRPAGWPHPPDPAAP